MNEIEKSESDFRLVVRDTVAPTFFVVAIVVGLVLLVAKGGMLFALYVSAFFFLLTDFSLGQAGFFIACLPISYSGWLVFSYKSRSAEKFMLPAMLCAVVFFVAVYGLRSLIFASAGN